MDKITQRLIAASALLATFSILTPLYKNILASKSPCLFKYNRAKLSPANSKPITVYQRDLSTRDLIALNQDLGAATAISPDGDRVYQLTDRGIRATNYQTGEQQNFDLPPYFPELSWGMDLTYDTKRDLVTLVSLGGEGYLYRFDAKQDRWLDVHSLNNTDLKSISYNLATDTYTAEITDYGVDGTNSRSISISGTGELPSGQF